MNWKQSTLRFALLGCLLVVTSAIAAQDRIGWITDLRQARDVAERENRLVLLHFWSPDCAPCKRLERYVFNQPELIRAMNTGYVPVKINANQFANLAQHYNIEVVPTDVVVTPEGREVYRATSPQDMNQYIAMLDGVRASSSVGSHQPVSSQLPADVATGNPLSPQNLDFGSTYGTATQPGQTQTSQSSAPQSSAPQAIENRYVNQLGGTTPQEQAIAPRYANPYAQESSAGTNNRDSAWSAPDNERPQHPDSIPAATTHATHQGATANMSGGRAGVPEQQPVAAPSLPANGGSRYEPPLQPSAPQHAAGPPQQSPPTNRWDADRLAQNTQLNQPLAPQHVNTPQQAVPSTPSNDPAIDGYCPVTLVHSRHWTPGDKQWGAVHQGRVYLFAGEEEQRLFLGQPHVYAPLLSGYDPVHYAETGQLVSGRREFGLYVDAPGPIALFADEASLQRFQANATYYMNRVRQAQLPGQPVSR